MEMNWIIPCIWCLLFCFATKETFSQRKSGHVDFGIKAGVNASKMTYSNYPYPPDRYIIKSIGGFYGGLFLDIPIAKRFSIQIETFYSQTGYRQATVCQACSMFYNERVHYISVPLLLKLRFSGLGIYAGPQFGILVQARRNMENSFSDAKESYESTDLSLVGGLAYTFRFGLGFDVRYQKGIKDIASRNSNLGDPKESKFKMNVAQFGLHFKFYKLLRQARRVV